MFELNKLPGGRGLVGGGGVGMGHSLSSSEALAIGVM